MMGRHAVLRLLLVVGMVMLTAWGGAEGRLGLRGGAHTVQAWTPRAVVRSASHYISSDGQWLVIVGEVENVSDVPLDPVRILATYRDSQGRYLGRDIAYALVQPLLPGERSPFLVLDRAPAGFATFDVRVRARPARVNPLPPLDLPDTGSTFLDEEGTLFIVGEVLNPLSTPVQRVRVAVTLYGEEGEVVNVVQAQVLREVIPPGERSPYVARVEQGPVDLTAWRAQATYEPASPEALVGGLSVRGLIPYVDREGFLVLRGTAHNAGTDKANFVRVVAALYDSQGRILNASFSYPLNYHLAPGTSDVFEVKFRSHFDGWTSYEVFVDSTP